MDEPYDKFQNWIILSCKADLKKSVQIVVVNNVDNYPLLVLPDVISYTKGYRCFMVTPFHAVVRETRRNLRKLNFK